MTETDARAIVDTLARRIIDEIGPSRLVTGLSGGADSTLALLISCRVRELRPDCYVQAVHCIHGLDEDDPVWLAHCQKLCARLNVPLKTPRLNIVYGNGRSPEEISRAERYRALLEELKGGALVLGHQADDQTENFLLALKRGSGPRGLSGMRFVVRDERGIIIRPLLELTKARIEEIIAALGFDFVFDISNTYLKFERNYMRLKVLPLLRGRFPGIDEAIRRSQRLCGHEHDLAERYVRERFERCFDVVDRWTLTLNFAALPLEDEPLMHALLRQFIMRGCVMPPELSVIESALELCRIADNDQRGLVEVEDRELRRYRDCLYLIKSAAYPQKGEYRLRAGGILSLGSFTYFLEVCSAVDPLAFNLKGESVTLDFACPGSTKIKPRSRAHSRELKKLFAEYAVPYFARGSQCVLRDDIEGRILGVGNIFVCGKVTEGERCFRLRIERME